jgi:hypothetical protein
MLGTMTVYGERSPNEALDPYPQFARDDLVNRRGDHSVASLCCDRLE